MTHRLLREAPRDRTSSRPLREIEAAGGARPRGWARALPGLLLLLLSGAAEVSGQGVVGGCEIYPPDHVWNVRVDDLPVHPRSADFVASIGAGTVLHPDFGSGVWPPGSNSPIGIPWATVGSAQPDVGFLFLYDDESDPGPYPFPIDVPIEGGPDSGGDRHVLVVDRQTCVLSETFDTWPPGTSDASFCDDDQAWCAGSGAVFDLGEYALRPEGWTSADAAGLPILPGLVRREEVEAGEIRHAIRFTASVTRTEFVWPARHQAGSTGDPGVPAMGQRFRLRPDFDLSGFSPEVVVILRALQRYGLILADNGSDWYLSGTPHESWDNDVLHELDGVTGADFEAVDASPLMLSPDSGRTTRIFADGFESGGVLWWSSDGLRGPSVDPDA